MYLYINYKPKSGGEMWRVGYYDPAGNFHTESDYYDKEEAAKRVHYLNGGSKE